MASQFLLNDATVRWHSSGGITWQHEVAKQAFAVGQDADGF